jgi:hypothetical protein
MPLTCSRNATDCASGTPRQNAFAIHHLWQKQNGLALRDHFSFGSGGGTRTRDTTIKRTENYRVSV